jgi:ketosteroid isomerase-like protein
MYKATVRAIVRHGITRMNAGDPEFILRLARDDAELCFPGRNSWAEMFRPAEKGLTAHVTHRGIAECRAFAERFVDEGLQFGLEDILVNGPPWRTRVAVRAFDSSPDHPAEGSYCNRAIAFLELRWGKLVRWEDYEDTERVAAWDTARAGAAVGG